MIGLSFSVFPDIVPSKYTIHVVGGPHVGRQYVTDDAMTARRAQHHDDLRVSPSPPPWTWGESIGLGPSPPVRIR